MNRVSIRVIFAIVTTAFFNSCSEKDVSNKSILVVLAHPDDETAFGPSLVKYSRLGYKVQLFFAVDARFRGYNNNPDSLAIVNRREAECSCEKLGIEQPMFTDLISLDRKHGKKDGVRDAVEAGVSLREKLKETISEIKPGLIITFGPDGEYGHPEHIIVGSVVTELLLREGWVSKYPLYYFGWPKSIEEGNDGWVRYADDSYFNVVVDYTDEDEQKAYESLKCYSDFSQEEKEEMMKFEKERENKLWFREFRTTEGVRDAF